MFTLGLSNMRDAAAALVRAGQIVAAAEEERFVRIKHVSALPVHAVRYCLKEAGLRLSDVDAVAVPWKYWEIGTRARLALSAMLRSPQLFREKGRRSIERLRQEWWELACLRRKLSEQIDGTPCPPVTFLDHHMCHAASAFLVSPFERAAVLVADGASESHSTMTALADRRQIQGLEMMPSTPIPRLSMGSAATNPINWKTRTIHPFQYVGFRYPPVITPLSWLLEHWMVGEHEPWTTLAHHYPADLVERMRLNMADTVDSTRWPGPGPR